jgi:hypothetical protein
MILLVFVPPNIILRDMVGHHFCIQSNLLQCWLQRHPFAITDQDTVGSGFPAEMVSMSLVSTTFAGSRGYGFTQQIR